MVIVKVQIQYQTQRPDDKYARNHAVMVTVATTTLQRGIALVEAKYGHHDKFQVIQAKLESYGSGSDVIVDSEVA